MMAFHWQHKDGSSSSSMSIRTAEPTKTIEETIDLSETVDLHVDENTRNTPTTSDRFPKYEDCQETLVEMSFIKWYAGFRLECRKISCRTNTELYFGLLNFFYLNIAPEMVDCRYKVNKSTLLKSYLEQTMMFFRRYYKIIKKDKGDVLDVIHYDRMSSILAYYIDLNLMSSQRFKGDLSDKKTTKKIDLMLSVILEQKFDYVLDSLFQLYYVFNGSNGIHIESIMHPILKNLLSEHTIPKIMNYLTYMRYILCFKLSKKIIHFSKCMTNSVKTTNLKNLKFLLKQLNVPNDFMSQHEIYNWSNWPKLTMSPNGTPDSIQRDLKNVSLVLYGAKLSLKECYKDILDASKKDISILLKPIEEQCKILRPDLFAISKEEVLRNWNENFDNTLKPLIPTRQSCSSMMKKIKFNLFAPIEYECLENDNKTNEVCDVGLSKVKDFKGSENYSIRNKKHFSYSTIKCMKKSNLINSSTNKIIDDSNNDKSNENDKCPVDALKTSMATHESFPANLKPQSSEDEIQVNVKKSKSSEKHVLYRNDGRFDPTLSNKPSILNYTSEITSTSHHPVRSYSKGSKRNQCSSFDENRKNKKMCRTQSKHEKNVLNYNPNLIIDSNCQNSNVESSYVTLNNNNSVIENPENSQNINGVSSLMNESSVKRNKWATKASNSELSITAVLNLKHTQSNCTVSDKDECIENCAKIINLSSDHDGTASPSSGIQWPIKLSHSDPYSPEPKPTTDNSEQMEIEPTSSDTGGNNNPKTGNLLSIRNSEEMTSTLVSSRQSINENENTQMYGLPMDQKLSHVEHPYVKKAINSNAQDLVVVNVLSPVSINSTDIPTSSWVPDISLVHSHNDHNDIGCDHSQSSLQQFNGLCNSININTSRVTNRNNEVELLNNMQLVTPTMSRSYSYNQNKSRIFPEDSYTAAMSPSKSSVSNSTYGSEYDVNQVPLAVTNYPVSVSPKYVAHGLNDSSSSIYYSSSMNTCYNGLKKKSIIEQQPSYDFAMNKSRSADMNIMERGSSSNKDKHDVIPVVSDEFSDFDSMDLRTSSVEPNDNNLCINNVSVSSLKSTDLESINTLNSFEKGGNWSIIENLSDTTNHHQIQNLKRYTDPTEIFSVPINLKESHVKKVFLENKSPPQVYYRPITDFRVSSDVDMTNYGSIEHPNLINLENRQRNFVKMFSNDTFIHPILQSTDNDPNLKQTLINGYNGICNIQYNQLLTSNTGTWHNIPVLEQLTERCLCDICGDFDCKLNHNQENVRTYVEGKKPSIEEQNCENELLTNTQIPLSWKKHLAQRFTSAENGEKQSISQTIDTKTERHIKCFKHDSTINFRQSSVGNLTNSSHQPILRNFHTTSQEISLDSSPILYDRGLNHDHMSRYYSDRQMYAEFPHAYLQVPGAHFSNSSTNSYYGSPINMPSDNFVPFCSSSLSIDSVSHSQSSDRSIPSLVETVATAVPEHDLLGIGMDVISAAIDLMCLSKGQTYISTSKTTDTVSSTTTT